uniref:Uncharacterized protein n=1 Tax=Anguilla anguilla TaxID=7936 RepID=A0A0E9WMK4_ANGAN
MAFSFTITKQLVSSLTLQQRRSQIIKQLGFSSMQDGTSGPFLPFPTIQLSNNRFNNHTQSTDTFFKEN